MIKAPISAGICLSLVAMTCSATAKHDAALEEVIVTAQKRVESLQDTPISLTTFSSKDLDKENITDLGDIASKVPSLTIEPYPTNNSALRIFIRGVGLEDVQITQDPPVGVYMDGVYIARSTGLAMDVADLERIEVLRGPQGTLYGRNSTGGAINLITRPPSTKRLTFKQKFTAGNRSLFSSKTTINVPMGERLAARINYLARSEDGFMDNTGPGKNFGDRKAQGYRLALRWEINDRLRLDYAYDHSSINFVNYPYQPVLRPNTTPASSSTIDRFRALLAEQAQNFVTYSDNRRSKMATPVPMQSSHTRVQGHMLTLDWDLAKAMRVKYIGAYRELYDSPYADLSGGSQSPYYRIDSSQFTSLDGSLSLPGIPTIRRQKQWSHEFQFTGTIFDRVDYILGLYYFQEHGSTRSLPRHLQSIMPLFVNTSTAATTTTYVITTAGGSYTIDNSSSAVYGRATWTPPILDDRLHLTFGARYSRDKRRATKLVDNATLFESQTVDNSTGAATAASPSTIATTTFNAHGSKRYSNTSYDFIAKYDLSEDTNIYIKYSEAYKSGGFNTAEPDESRFVQGFDPEYVNAYELGLKSEWLQRRLRFNGDVFFSRYKDMQLQFKIPGGIADSRVLNAGRSRMSGAEIKMDLLAMPSLLFHLNYAYLETRILKVRDPVTGQNIADEYTFSNAPKNSLTASMDWTVAHLTWADLSLHVSYDYMDDRNGSSRTAISRLIYLRSYHLFNARLGLENINAFDGKLSVALWGKNLGDEEYVINGLATLPHASRAVLWGEPRTYGIDVIYHY